MRVITAMAMALALSVAAPAAAADPVLLPRPQAITPGEGVLPLAGPFAVRIEGCSQPFAGRAAARFQADVAKLRPGLPATGRGPALMLSCRDRSAGFLTLEARERYRLTVDAAGVKVEADGPAGVLHGLATLRQLVGAEVGGLRFVRIDDAPRFAWRGVMIDTSRHFMSVATVKRQIDAMERVKLDVLHLHLSDNEGFRIESRRYPRLTQVATHGEFYTQAQIRELVAYAADRGVRIVPEIDVPAHTAAILAAYPELAAKTDPAQPLAAANPALNPASEATYAFLDGLLGEVSALFPDRYFHVGGDEVSDGAWAKDPEIQAFMAAHGLASRTALEAYFHARVRGMLARRGKTEVGWEEIAATEIPKDVVVQAWRFSNAIGTAVRAGHRTVVSAGYYLDLLNPAAAHYAIDPLDLQADGFTPQEVARARAASPLAAAAVTPLALKPMDPLTAEEESRVLGGEGPLWAELVSDEMLDARLWPRAAALAERFWSPGDLRDPQDLQRRLAVVQTDLETLGLQSATSRARMAERLAPGQAQTVLTFLSAVAPVRHMAHNHTIAAYLRGDMHPPAQALTSLADAAPVDSMEVWRLEAGARRVAAGDLSAAAAVRAQLQAWADNDSAFAALARGRPNLEAALPTSSEVAALARIGLSALDARTQGAALTPETLAAAHAALKQADDQVAASARPILTFLNRQPPADLMVMLGPAVRTLVDAADAASARQ